MGGGPASYILELLMGTFPAKSRHTRRLLWLLPSGPDLVNRVALRENQQSPH